MKNTALFLYILLTAFLLLGCTVLRDKPRIENNDRLLPANVMELPNAGDIPLEELETGTWLQMSPEQTVNNELLAKPQDDGPYRLGVGDIIEITLYGEGDAETRRNLPIDPSGNITYMLLGNIPAAGRTINELTADMRSRLKEKLNYAILNVVPVSFGS
ncbi:MAG: polysaccharide biosynthesis/export family protein [Kiritimatiellales bacterium]